MSTAGPLGNLPGMFYDSVKKRYFPNPPRPTPAPLPPVAGPSRARRQLPRKRTKVDLGDTSSRKDTKLRADAEPWSTTIPSTCSFIAAKTPRLPTSSGRPRGIHSRLAPSNSSSSWGATISSAQSDYYANLRWTESTQAGSTECESITQLHQYPTGAFQVATDHGRIAMRRPNGRIVGFTLCGTTLVGVHTNLPRMSVLSIMGGAEPHVHRYYCSSDNPDFTTDGETIELDTDDVFCMSTYGDLCTIGMTGKLLTIRDDSENNIEQWHSSRSVPSDPLAVHHATDHLVYAGLRNGRVVVDDQRTKGGRPQVVGKTTRGKAVVGVKRLRDSAVPYGLVASGMMNELLLFDVRYGLEPVRSFQGHINLHNSDLGMTTTSDDQVLFAAGSDRRIRAWSTRTGDRLQPNGTGADPALIGPNASNPLSRIFDARPVAICLTESGLMDVAAGPSVHRFTGATGYQHFPLGNDLSAAGGGMSDDEYDA